MYIFADIDWKEAVVNGAATTSITLTDLNADENYYVKVKSASYLGESAFTKPIEQQVLRDGQWFHVPINKLLVNDEAAAEWHLTESFIKQFATMHRTFPVFFA